MERNLLGIIFFTAAEYAGKVVCTVEAALSPQEKWNQRSSVGSVTQYRWGRRQSMSTSCPAAASALYSSQKACSEPLRTYAHRYISRKSRLTS